MFITTCAPFIVDHKIEKHFMCTPLASIAIECLLIVSHSEVTTRLEIPFGLLDELSTQTLTHRNECNRREAISEHGANVSSLFYRFS